MLLSSFFFLPLGKRRFCFQDGYSAREARGREPLPVQRRRARGSRRARARHRRHFQREAESWPNLRRQETFNLKKKPHGIIEVKNQFITTVN